MSNYSIKSQLTNLAKLYSYQPNIKFIEQEDIDDAENLVYSVPGTVSQLYISTLDITKSGKDISLSSIKGSISGKEFNEIYDQKLSHNKIILPFYSRSYTCTGNVYYLRNCKFTNCMLNRPENQHIFTTNNIYTINIPDDAVVYKIEDTCKIMVSKFTLSDKVGISYLSIWENDEYSILYLKKMFGNIYNYKIDKYGCYSNRYILAKKYIPLVLTSIKIQTEEICLLSVFLDYKTLEYVRNQSDKICITALKRNEDAVRLIREYTPSLCKSILKHFAHDSRCMEHIKTYYSLMKCSENI